MEAQTDEELAKLTFHEWLQYFLRLPAVANKRSKALMSDQQYIDLLHQCTGPQKISEQMRERTQVELQWMYNQLKSATYKRVDIAYRVTPDRTDTGPVLVTFVEPTEGKGEAFKRRHPTSRGELTLGMMRRCIPFSQLEDIARMECGRRRTRFQTAPLDSDGTAMCGGEAAEVVGARRLRVGFTGLLAVCARVTRCSCVSWSPTVLLGSGGGRRCAARWEWWAVTRISWLDQARGPLALATSCA